MRLFVSTLLCLWLPAQAWSSEVALAELGELQLAFATVEALQEVPGPSVQARVTPREGSLYRVQLPRDARRAQYLVGNGAQVGEGQPFVVLQGPEIHHFLLEYRAVERRYLSAEARYVRSRESHEQQALLEEQWIGIVDSYLALQLEYEHMRHFMELVQPAEEVEKTMTLLAPIAGYVQFDATSRPLLAGGDVAVFLAAADRRLRARVPAAGAERLSKLQVGACLIAVDAVDGNASGLLLTAWSAAIPASCNFPLNSLHSATPVYQREAFQLPRSAVFTWHEKTHVLVRAGDVLRAVPVELLMPVGDAYAVTASVGLAGSAVLTRSVSAVQGMLMGLGGE